LQVGFCLSILGRAHRRQNFKLPCYCWLVGLFMLLALVLMSPTGALSAQVVKFERTLLALPLS
jgi:hypothetical protein